MLGAVQCSDDSFGLTWSGRLGASRKLPANRSRQSDQASAEEGQRARLRDRGRRNSRRPSQVAEAFLTIIISTDTENLVRRSLKADTVERSRERSYQVIQTFSEVGQTAGKVVREHHPSGACEGE